MDLGKLRDILDSCKFNDWKLWAEQFVGEQMYLYVQFTDKFGNIWNSRKWVVSRFATKSEVVQTAFKAVLTAMEHEARESFTYKGRAIFGPHFDVDDLVNVVDTKRQDRRVG